ncbi:MAG: diguanylate cyclase, partial [Thiohalomonadaceae bacterium]
MIDGGVRSGARIADWLRRHCTAAVFELDTLAELPARLRLAQAEGCDRPALAVLAAQAIDDAFLLQCSRVQRLVEEGWLGLVTIMQGEPPHEASVDAALRAGCLDVVHAPGPQAFPHLHARLLLAARILHERRLRIAREQMYEAQLAERRIMEARQHYAASHDAVTDLANRRAFEEALNAAIEMGRRRGITHALLHLDLDRFKLHNDAAGHGAGDYLLLEVANLLRSSLPPEYLAARLGGDEFAVLLQGANEEEAMRLAEELRARIAALEPDGSRIVYHVAASIGVAVFLPGAVPGASQALAQAEQACYVAKTRGGNAIHRYSRDDRALQHLREDMHWAPHIRRALNEDRFFLAFQPILSVADNTVSHYEALLRIPSAYGGDGESARFMLAAERLGLAQQIDMWVVSRAMDFLAEHVHLSLGVNLSERKSTRL